MGLMDEVKKRMEAFGKEVQKATRGDSSSNDRGQLLGSSESRETVVAVFERGGPLGMKVTKSNENEAVVREVEPNSMAAKTGVKEGDVIVRVESRIVTTYDEFLAAFQSSSRPVEMGFRRAALLAASQGLPRSISEREARREAQAKAALERDGAWAKRVASRPQGGRWQQKASDGSTEYKKSTNPETRAAWKAAEERADKTVKDLGYDPFKSVSTGAATSVRQPAQTTTTAGRRLGDGSADETRAYEAASAAAQLVVDAFSAHPDKAQVAICVSTLLKVLDNAATKEEDKYKRVRLANAAFQAKVLSVPGGLEALCAAGFKLATDPNNQEETILQLYSDFDRPTLQAITDALDAFFQQIQATT